MVSRLVLAAAALVLIAGPAAAQPGSDTDPIVVHMKRGTDSVHYTGVLKQGVECCAYSITAKAGQVLKWKETGAAVRVLIKYPNGDVDGPGIPNPLPLATEGTYVFTISPDTMADGAFGRFSLTLTIPPLKPAASGATYGKR